MSTFRVQLNDRRYGIPPGHHANRAQVLGLANDPEYVFSKIKFDVPRYTSMIDYVINIIEDLNG